MLKTLSGVMGFKFRVQELHGDYPGLFREALQRHLQGLGSGGPCREYMRLHRCILKCDFVLVWRECI